MLSSQILTLPRIKGVFDLFLSFDEDGALSTDDIDCNGRTAHVRPTTPPCCGHSVGWT